MEDYRLEPQPFYISDDNSVWLFKGSSTARNGAPIVAKRHEFLLLRDKDQFSKRLNEALNVGLAQARVDHPHSCKLLEIRLDISGAPEQYFVYHILEALKSNVWQEVEQRKKRPNPCSELEMWDFLEQTTSALSFAHDKVTDI